MPPRPKIVISFLVLPILLGLVSLHFPTTASAEPAWFRPQRELRLPSQVTIRRKEIRKTETWISRYADKITGWRDRFFGWRLGPGEALCLYPCLFDGDYCFAGQGLLGANLPSLLPEALAKTQGAGIEQNKERVLGSIYWAERALEMVERAYREKHGIREGEPLPPDAPMTEVIDMTREALQVMKDSLADTAGSKNNIAFVEKDRMSVMNDVSVVHEVEGNLGGYYDAASDSVVINTTSVGDAGIYLHEATHRVYQQRHPYRNPTGSQNYERTYLFKSETAANAAVAVTSFDPLGNPIGSNESRRIYNALMAEKGGSGWLHVFEAAKRGALRPYRHLADVDPLGLSNDLLPPPPTIHLGPQRPSRPARPLSLTEAEQDRTDFLDDPLLEPDRGLTPLTKVHEDWLDRGRPPPKRLDDLYEEAPGRFRRGTTPCMGGRPCPGRGGGEMRRPPEGQREPGPSDDPYERGREIALEGAATRGEEIFEERSGGCETEPADCEDECKGHCEEECVSQNLESCGEAAVDAFDDCEWGESPTMDADEAAAAACSGSEIRADCQNDCEERCQDLCEENRCDPDSVEIPDLDFDCPLDEDEGCQVEECHIS